MRRRCLASRVMSCWMKMSIREAASGEVHRFSIPSAGVGIVGAIPGPGKRQKKRRPEAPFFAAEWITSSARRRCRGQAQVSLPQARVPPRSSRARKRAS